MPKAHLQSSIRPDADLDDWLLVTSTKAFDPTHEEIRLVGKIFNDRRQRYSDGKWVITSALRSSRRLIAPGATIRTQNTCYLLCKRSVREDIALD